MSTHRIIMALGITVTMMCGSTFATFVLTFDDLPTPPSGMAPIPNGYGGFDWSNFYYHLNNYGGYKNGCVSPPHDAFNWYANPALVYDSSFDFIGAYFTGAWNEGLNIKVEGYAGANLIYSKTVVASYYSPTWYTFDFLGVDKLRFSSFGGYDAEPGDNGSGAHFVIDNFTFVPEPGTILLVGLGGLVLRLHSGQTLLRKRRK